MPELIRAIKRISGIEQVALTTNGVMLATQAKNLIAAGLDAINLSLNTLDAKTFAGSTRRNLFDNIRAGLQTLLDENSGLSGIPTAEIFTRIEKVFGALTPVDGNIFLSGPARYFGLKDFRGQIGFLDALEYKFCGAGDEEIYAAVERAIYNKPREHFFNASAGNFDRRKMYQIGG